MANTEIYFAPGPDAVFHAKLRDGHLEFQQCMNCEAFAFYPRVLCPVCGSTNFAWKPATGRGIIYSFTIIRQRKELGGDYNIAVIELEEGVRMMSTVRYVPLSQLYIGMPVVAQIEDVEGQAVVTFVRG